MFGLTEVLVIAAIVLLLFGAKKLPELGKSAREMVDNFKDGKNGDDVVDTEATESEDAETAK